MLRQTEDWDSDGVDQLLSKFQKETVDLVLDSRKLQRGCHSLGRFPF